MKNCKEVFEELLMLKTLIERVNSAGMDFSVPAEEFEEYHEEHLRKGLELEKERKRM